MTPTQLAEIEARAKAGTTNPWLHQSRGDSLDLIAHIRELEEEMNTLLREHNHALAAIREAS